MHSSTSRPFLFTFSFDCFRPGGRSCLAAGMEELAGVESWPPSFPSSSASVALLSDVLGLFDCFMVSCRDRNFSVCLTSNQQWMKVKDLVLGSARAYRAWASFICKKEKTMKQLLEDNKHSNIESNKGDVRCHLHAQCKEYHLDVDARSRRRMIEISCSLSVCLPFFSRAKQQSYQTQNIFSRGSAQRSLPNTTCLVGHLQWWDQLWC